MLGSPESLTASSQPLCRFPIRIAVCRTFELSSAHPSPHDAEHVLLLQQSFSAGWPSFAFSASSTFLQYPWGTARFVVHRPTVGQWAVDALKVFPASYEPAKNVSLRNIVAAL